MLYFNPPKFARDVHNTKMQKKKKKLSKSPTKDMLKQAMMISELNIFAAVKNYAHSIFKR